MYIYIYAHRDGEGEREREDVCVLCFVAAFDGEGYSYKGPLRLGVLYYTIA